MRNLEKIQCQIEKYQESILMKPTGIIEEDTSITFKWGKGKSWNLPNQFLKLRPYQQEVHDAVFKRKYDRVYLAWSRQLGKEVTTWVLLLKYCLLHRCTGVMLYPNIPHAKRVLMEGKTNLADTSIDFLDYLPPFIDREKAVNQSSFRIDLPNGSTIWLAGAENYDNLRGMAPKIVVLSEYAFQDPLGYESIYPAVVRNKGIVVMQTTFDGKNHAYKLWERAQELDYWFTSFLTIDKAVDENGVRYTSEEEIDKLRAEGVPESKIQQEYFMSVEGDDEKYIFGQTLSGMRSSGHIGQHPWQPAKVVYTCWDLGANDATSIVLMQVINGEPTIVGYFEFKGTSYEHDIEQITKWRVERNLSLGCHILPHDGKNRSKMADGKTAQSPMQYISQKLGEPCKAVERPKTKEYGVKLTRSFLPRFKIDETSCERLLECLSSHAKEYDRKNDVYKQTGRHDWTSHAVDAVQTACIAYEKKMFVAQRNQSAVKYIK